MENKDTGTLADFRNTSGDTDKPVTSCGFRVTAFVSPEEKCSSEKIQANSKETAWIKSALPLTADKESDKRDARFQEGPVPGDFGDHKPIPEEAMTVVPLGQDEKEISLSVQKAFARAFGLSVEEDEDEDFYVRLRDKVVRFTKEEISDVEYFQKTLFAVLDMKEEHRK